MATLSRLSKFSTGSYVKFAGLGLLVGVGYMDPGNWATDLAGGSRYGYTLLWVILAANLMAMVLQTLSARLGIATGKDLARACRDYYPKPVSICLWILCELAIVACDVAEVIGSAVALQLLFGIPILAGVLITGLDVILFLALTRFGFRKLEAVIAVMVATIFFCFVAEIAMAGPNWGAVGAGLVTPKIPDSASLLIAVGILGATVMPHNLYLHSGLAAQRRAEFQDVPDRTAARNATLDTIASLGAAFFVNAAILVLAAAVFYGKSQPIEGLEEAHKLLTPSLGGGAAMLFAIALLCAGQASTITATLAGQISMEGFLDWKASPMARRIVTRGLALIPAVALVAGGSAHTIELLTFTQVVLSLQLPFAAIPLIAFTASRKRMGDLASPRWLTVLGYLIGAAIISLNIVMLYQTFRK